MDALAAHHVEGVREAIETRTAELARCPAYSADPNPTAHLLAKLEAPRRQAKAGIVDALREAIGRRSMASHHTSAPTSQTLPVADPSGRKPL